MKSLSEVAALVGLIRQRIQDYEKIGIAFKPTHKDDHGYWRYGEREIERLWQIKFYQELDFRVPDIKKIFDDPNYNKHDAIEAQIIELEKKKKKIEMMIEIARSCNEMDLLPSDTLLSPCIRFENVPFETWLPLSKKIIELEKALGKALPDYDDFMNKVYGRWTDASDFDAWSNALERILEYSEKGYAYDNLIVQKQVEVISSLDRKAVGNSLFRAFLQSRGIVEYNRDDIEETYGTGKTNYVIHAIEVFYNRLFIVPENPIIISLDRIEKLAYDRHTTGSAEVQNEIKSIHNRISSVGIFSEEIQVEYLLGMGSLIGSKEYRDIFDHGREKGVCWFISRAIQIYCKHQQEAMTKEGESNE